MKSTSSVMVLLFTVCITASLISSPALAREKKTKTQVTPQTEPVPGTLPATTTPSAPKKMSIGLSSAGAFAGTSPAITGALELDALSLIQGYLAVPSSSPFTFDVGGVFKRTIAQSGTTGLHVGGGIALGVASKFGGGGTVIEIDASDSTTSFFFETGGVFGIHLPFPGTENIMIHLDAGPALHIQSGANDFRIAPVSGLLGASILYSL